MLFFCKVKNRILDSGSSWNDWYTVAIIVGVIFVIVALVFLANYFIVRRTIKLSRMIEFKGKRVDPESLVTVTMIGNTAETLTKGEIFVAPLIEKEGCEFAGWFLDTACTKPYFNRPIKTDITLYPKWVKHS